MEVKAEEIELVEVSKLIPYEENMNEHSADQIERLCDLIKYQGFRDPLIVQKGTNIIAAGHGRLEAAKALGMQKVPVIYEEFKSEEEFYAFVTSHNAIASWSQLDLSRINNKIVDFGPDFDIEMLGMKDFTIEPAEKFEAQADEDSVPELKEDPITKRGDIWLLGEHRVMCGDSTMIDDVEKLMNGEKADMVYIDPPYGVSYQCTGGGGVLKRNKFDKIIGDDKPYEPADIFGLNLSDNYIIWGANHFASKLPDSSGWIAWIKIGDGKSNNQSDLELAWTSFKKPARRFNHIWRGMIRASERKEQRVHPTQKPVELARWCFDDCDAGLNIFDGYLGSGSTLIACEKTNRKCYGMELAEKYCDVIINRWQEYTGKKATLEATGQTYDELKNDARPNGIKE